MINCAYFQLSSTLLYRKELENFFPETIWVAMAGFVIKSLWSIKCITFSIKLYQKVLLNTEKKISKQPLHMFNIILCAYLSFRPFTFSWIYTFTHKEKKNGCTVYTRLYIFFRVDRYIKQSSWATMHCNLRPIPTHSAHIRTIEHTTSVWELYFHSVHCLCKMEIARKKLYVNEILLKSSHYV